MDEKIPTRENCDPKDPEEFLLWTFVDLPDLKGTSLIMPLDFWRGVSKHQGQCGVMTECPSCGYSKEPEIRWRPLAHASPLGGVAGEWVPAETPIEEDEQLASKLSELAPHVRRAVFETLKKEFLEE